MSDRATGDGAAPFSGVAACEASVGVAPTAPSSLAFIFASMFAFFKLLTSFSSSSTFG
jgi:hypothetical protein